MGVLRTAVVVGALLVIIGSGLYLHSRRRSADRLRIDGIVFAVSFYGEGNACGSAGLFWVVDL